MSTATQVLAVPRNSVLTRACDYAELTKLRVTTLIVMTAWCGYYFGALKSGSWVVCDRFTDATLAYQGAGKGVPLDLIERLAQASHPGLKPDRTLVFDCPYDVARQRLAASGKALDRFEREDRTFFERVRSAYLARAKAEPERMRIIDATQDMAAIRKMLEKSLAGL